MAPEVPLILSRTSDILLNGMMYISPGLMTRKKTKGYILEFLNDFKLLKQPGVANTKYITLQFVMCLCIYDQRNYIHTNYDVLNMASDFEP